MIKLVGRISRLLGGFLLLWLIWGSGILAPLQRDLPADTVVISSQQDLDSLNAGQRFVIEGEAYPEEGLDRNQLWQGRFAYRRALWCKDEFGSLEEVVTAYVRPMVRFQWPAGEWILPADSYEMKDAPKAPGDSILLTTEHHVGFSTGDSAVALGRKQMSNAIVVEELALGPINLYIESLQRDNHTRSWISMFLRLIVSFFALSIIVSALKGDRKPVAPTETA